MNTLAPQGGDALAAQLAELTRSLNQIDRTRDDHVLELGRKLIQVRQILQTVNGAAGARTAADGLRPLGFGKWCKAAGIELRTAQMAVRRAADPDRYSRTIAAMNQRNRRIGRFLLTLRGSWPNWTDEDRAKVIAAVRTLAQETNNAKA